MPPVYYYVQNQMILTTLLDKYISPGLGVIHSSEQAYIYANLTAYNATGDIYPTVSDVELLRQESRSWSTFVSMFKPSVFEKKILEGWMPAYNHVNDCENAKMMVISGPEAGMSSLDGGDAVARQRLGDRCGVSNQPAIIRQLQY